MNIIKPRVANKVLNVKFKEKFSENLESCSFVVFEDLANVLDIKEKFVAYRSIAPREDLTPKRLAYWLLETWIDHHNESASLALFEASIRKLDVGKDIWNDTGTYFHLA